MAKKFDIERAKLDALCQISEGTKFGGVKYDNIDITYVSSGNGAGEIETVTYMLKGKEVKKLTLTYNSDNKIIKIER